MAVRSDLMKEQTGGGGKYSNAETREGGGEEEGKGRKGRGKTCPKSPILTMKEERTPFWKMSLGSGRSLTMMLSKLRVGVRMRVRVRGGRG